MNSTHVELVDALRKSLKENERLKRDKRQYLAALAQGPTEPVAVVESVAGIRVGSIPRMACGRWWPRDATWCPNFRRPGLGYGWAV